jgi:hypothetical protein
MAKLELTAAELNTLLLMLEDYRQVLDSRGCNELALPDTVLVRQMVRLANGKQGIDDPIPTCGNRIVCDDRWVLDHLIGKLRKRGSAGMPGN